MFLSGVYRTCSVKVKIDLVELVLQNVTVTYQNCVYLVIFCLHIKCTLSNSYTRCPIKRKSKYAKSLISIIYYVQTCMTYRANQIELMWLFLDPKNNSLNIFRLLFSKISFCLYFNVPVESILISSFSVHIKAFKIWTMQTFRIGLSLIYEVSLHMPLLVSY